MLLFLPQTADLIQIYWRCTLLFLLFLLLYTISLYYIPRQKRRAVLSGSHVPCRGCRGILTLLSYSLYPMKQKKNNLGRETKEINIFFVYYYYYLLVILCCNCVVRSGIICVLASSVCYGCSLHEQRVCEYP
eukprot:Rmarinus@m.7787